MRNKGTPIFVSFCNDEIHRTKEAWRLKAAMKGLIAVFRKDKHDTDLLTLISETVHTIDQRKNKITDKALLQELITTLKDKNTDKNLLTTLNSLI